MKLYTEEQVKSAFRIGLRENYIDEQDAENFANKGIKYLTSIELPSDEEMANASNHCKDGQVKVGFLRGVLWYQEQILNQNK